MPYPICKFDHLGESFDPAVEVPADHPLLSDERGRPDLFTEAPPTRTRRSRPASPQE